jgi:hypothetical protein
MPKPLRLALAVVVAVAAVVGLLLFVQSRDRSTISGDSSAGDGAAAPGRLLPDQGAEHRRPPADFRYATNPPASGPHLPLPVRREGAITRDQLLHALHAGNVVIIYGKAADEPRLRAVQDDVAGPFDPDLAAVGQAVILTRQPQSKDIIALAWRHELRTRSADDAKLMAFAEAFVGKGAGQ